MTVCRQLSVNPIFGFETVARWEVAAEQRDSEGKNKIDSKHLYSKQKMIISNFSKICSYLPVIRIITGLARILFAAMDKTKDPEKQSMNTKQILRGVAEIVAGYLLIIPDIIQTIRDNNTTNEYKLSHS